MILPGLPRPPTDRKLSIVGWALCFIPGAGPGTTRFGWQEWPIILHRSSNFQPRFRLYIWPKIIVADARDGMEYPMLTLDGGFDLTIATCSFMKLVTCGSSNAENNETYRAMMDEGFTSSLPHGMAKR